MILSIENIRPVKEYSELLSNLLALNIKIKNSNFSYDPHLSEITKLKHLFNNKSYIKEKKYYYGVVLNVQNNSQNPSIIEVHVDVPGFNFKKILHPDDLANPDFKLDFYEDLIFYHLQSTTEKDILPIVGGIAIVELAPNYPEHALMQKYDNKFVGMVFDQPYIQISKQKSKLQFSSLAGQEFTSSWSGNIPTLPPSDIPRNFTSEEVKQFLEKQKIDPVDEVMDKITPENEWKSAKSLFNSSMQNMTERDKQFFSLAAQELGFDLTMIMAIAFIESGMVGSSKSDAGAMGLMQVMPDTFKLYWRKIPKFREFLVKHGGPDLGDKKSYDDKYYPLNSPDYRGFGILAGAFILAEQAYDTSFRVNLTNYDRLITAALYNGAPSKKKFFKDYPYPGVNALKPTSNMEWLKQNLEKKGKDIKHENQSYIVRLNIMYKFVYNWRTELGNRPEEKNYSDVGDEQLADASRPPSAGGASATVRSPPINRPKLLLVDFKPDLATSNLLFSNRGAQITKVREDIAGDLYSIKDILNFYDIPLSLIHYDINLHNKEISKLRMVGLEISLNNMIGLTKRLDELVDDYFIGPDPLNKLTGDHKLKIYGNVRKKVFKSHEKYKIIDKPIDVYDLSETYNISSPKIVRIYRPVIDITKIFEDHDFVNKKPQKEFFVKSDPEKSNWNIFYKRNKVSIGDTYRDILKTVYKEDNSPIWKFPEKKWDGENFS